MADQPRRNLDFRTLRPRQRETYQRVARGITESRWTGKNPRLALREMGTSLETGLAFAPEAFEQLPDGTYRVRGTDDLVRILRMPTASGVTDFETRSSLVASEVARYDNAIEAWLGGNPYPLREFRNRRLVLDDGRRVDFLTDEDVLLKLARRGELSFESIYATTD